MIKPTPIDEEIQIDPKRYLVSRTDKHGVIDFANDYFAEISGYSKEELIGKPHSLIRHPDMPKIIFKLMWDRIQKGENLLALIKNLAKDGRYYWVFTSFEPQRDTDTGEIFGYKASRKAAPKDAVEIIDALYKKLVALEKEGGMEASFEYLDKFLKEKDPNLEIQDLMENIHKFY
ncbi:MAG: PAS domain-containing protein [Sulfurovum sp.]|jgi:PAS domain S-box-containing protein|nr:PAS domain-containing protein [Sulfurovum sp.]